MDVGYICEFMALTLIRSGRMVICCLTVKGRKSQELFLKKKTAICRRRHNFAINPKRYCDYLLQRKFVVLFKMRSTVNLAPLYMHLPGDGNQSNNILKYLVSTPQAWK